MVVFSGLNCCGADLWALADYEYFDIHIDAYTKNWNNFFYFGQNWNLIESTRGSRNFRNRIVSQTLIHTSNLTFIFNFKHLTYCPACFARLLRKRLYKVHKLYYLYFGYVILLLLYCYLGYVQKLHSIDPSYFRLMPVSD